MRRASDQRTQRSKSPSAKKAGPRWKLRLYVAGSTARCMAAIANLRRFCAEHLDAAYRIEVIDLLENPGRARADQIVAVPTLVRLLPAPTRMMMGDLSKTDRVLLGFDLGELRW